MTSIAIALHVVASVVWVGGMFFSYMALRPAAMSLDQGPRLLLWSRTFEHFFRWVGLSIIVLLVTGYWMIFQIFGGFKGLSLHLNLMQGIGIIMMLIFGHVRFAPYRRLQKAVISGNHEEAARNLCQIRKLILLNLILGLTTVAIASGGRYF